MRKPIAAVVAVLCLVLVLFFVSRSGDEDTPIIPDAGSERASASSIGTPTAATSVIAATSGDNAEDSAITKEAEQEETTGGEAVATSTEDEEAEDEGDFAVYIEGRVIDANGRPVEGAEVAVYRRVERMMAKGASTGYTMYSETLRFESTVSDKDGRYRLGTTQLLPIAVGASKEGHAGAGVDIKMAATSQPSANGKPVYQQDIQLGVEVVRYGRVVDNDQRPIADVAIEYGQGGYGYTTLEDGIKSPFARARTTSGDDGRFTLHGNGAGYGFAHLIKQGFKTEEVTFPDWPEAERLIVMTEANGRLYGRVTDWEEREGVSGVKLSYVKSSDPSSSIVETFLVEVTSDSEGNYEFTDVPAGAYFLTALTPSGKRVLNDVGEIAEAFTIGEGEELEVNLRVHDGFTLTGRVTNSITGLPLAGVRVQAVNDFVQWSHTHSQSAHIAISETDDEGLFVLMNASGVPNRYGRVTPAIELLKEGFQFEEPSHFKPYEMDTEEPYFVELEMTPVVTVSGRVLDLDSAPVTGAAVSRYLRSHEIKPGDVAITDRDGRYTVPIKAHAKGQILVRAPGYAMTFSEPFDVKEENIEDLDVVLDPGGTVDIRIQNQAGTPISDVYTYLAVHASERYILESGKESTASFWMFDVNAKSDAEGKIVFTNVPSTEAPKSVTYTRTSYELAVTPGEKYKRQSQEVEVKPRETTHVQIILEEREESHFLGGIVLNNKEQPVSGATVSLFMNDGWPKATTGTDGRFLFEKIGKDVNYIQVSHPLEGFANTWELTIDSKDHRIVLNENKLDLTVIVLDKATQNPIAGAQIKSLGDNVSSNHINRGRQAGSYMITAKNNLQLRFEITAGGYKPGSLTVMPDETRHELIEIVELEKE